MNIIPICFAFDSQLLFPAGVCLSSLLMNAEAETFYDIFILLPDKDEIDTTELDRLPEHYNNCSITYRRVGNVFENAFEIRGITTPAYYRFLIPNLVPEYDKILYSDVDVIFRSDLSKYYNEELRDCYFGAVDVCVAIRPDIKEYVEGEIHLDSSKGYFYSGNLVINSKKLREDNLLEKMVELSKRQFKFQDMDVMNIVCNGKIKQISSGFCITNYLYSLFMKYSQEGVCGISPQEIHDMLKNGVVHYNGAKPWNTWCYLHDIWWHYYRESIFYDERVCNEFYARCVNEFDKWTLWKRIKHLLRFFHK